MAATHAHTPSPRKRSPHDGPGRFSSSSPSDYLPTTETGLNQTLSPGYSFHQLSPNTILDEANFVDSSEYHTPSFDLDFLDPNATPTWTAEQHGIRPSDTVKVDASVNNEPRAGVAPAERSRLNEAEIPSLEDQERDKKLSEEIAKVRSWLECSSMGDEPSAGSADRSSPHRRRRPSTSGKTKPSDQTGPRASQGAHSSGLPKESTPGPGVTTDVDDANEGEDDDASDGEHSGSDSGTTPAATVAVPMDEGAATVEKPTATGEPFSEKYAGTKPWIDAPEEADSARIKEQPPSSNDAITMFMRKARDIETASLTATLGSRRRSEADLDSLFSVPGTIKGPSNASRKRDQSSLGRPSLFTRMVPRRSNSNARKRKDESVEPQSSKTTYQPPRQESSNNLLALKRVVSNSRPKSPRLDTNVPNQPSRSPTSPSQLLGSPWSTAKHVIQRARSRSDTGQNPGIAELFARQGGPPTLRVPGSELDLMNTNPTRLSRDIVDTVEDAEGDDDDSPNSAFPMALKIGERPAAPTYDAFKAHVRKLNPMLDHFMVERIAQEQIKRHKRLLEFRAKHDAVVKRGSCPSGDRCNTLGSGPDYNASVATGRTNETSTAIFIVAPPNGAPSKSDDSDEKSTSIPATFPDGIPLPPVSQLPAEFECPLCFHVKKFTKPSDWTKHVHEDVQPFTCTFPNCGEPKSFKRKADWVRHESERHRHLESWKCDVPECQHVCYRKDNFVQHLVREHRYPEPRVRLGRATSRGSSGNNDDGDIVAHLVEKCRLESPQQPQDEPCRFCGNLCNTWKKLTVHLAKHMEQISMPILMLIGHELPQSNMEHAFATGASQMSSLNSLSMQDPNRPARSPGGAHPIVHSQLPSVSVTNTTGSTYPPPNTSRGRANTLNPNIYRQTQQRMGNSNTPHSMSSMTQHQLQNMTSANDYTFPYANTAAGGSAGYAANFPGYPPYSFPASVSQSTGGHYDASMGAGSATYPSTWGAGPSQMHTVGSSQLGSSGMWQDPHLSASPIDTTLPTFPASSNASNVNAKSLYNMGSHDQSGFNQQGFYGTSNSNNDHFAQSQSQDAKPHSHVGSNAWNFQSGVGANALQSYDTAFPSRLPQQTLPSQSHQNLNMNDQAGFGGWSNRQQQQQQQQRFGDFYGNS